MADAGFVELEEGAEPSTPATGFKRTFVDSADGHLKVKDDAGAVVDLEAVVAPVTSVFGRTGAVVAVANDYSAAQVSNTAAGNIVATTVQAAINELDTEKAPIAHVGSSGVSEHAVATGSVAGFMSPSDFTKLAGVDTGATANSSDAYLLSRTNHTGTQAAATVTGLAAVATSGSKSDVGLGSVDNTADTAKPVSVAQAAADSVVQAYAIQRANHTGTQTASTISDFNAAADARDAINSAPIAHVGSGGSSHAQVVAGVSDGFMLAADKTKLDALPTGASITSSLALKVDKAGDTMTGALELSNLTGNAFVGFAPQNPVPATPSAGFRMYSGSTGRVAFKGTAGIPWSIDHLGLTATRVFTLPDVSGTFMFDPMTTNGDLITRSAGVASRIPIGTTNYLLRSTGSAAAWSEENLGQDFGDGDLGNATITGALTPTNISYYDTLTISGAGSINVGAGEYHIYCKTLDLSNAGANAIRANGATGGNSTAAAGGTAGGAIATAVLGGAGNGSAGGAGSVNAGAQAAAPTAQNPSNGGNGGTGPAGGAATSAGGAARTGAVASNYTSFGRFEQAFIRASTIITGGAGGAGGGGGGGTGALTGFGGGAGGSGGGMLCIFADTIITSGSTAAGCISAQGGNGGNSATATNLNTAAGAGGGGGGGGFVYIAYNYRIGSTVSGAVVASGGTGGNSGNSNGTATAAQGGQGGDGGRIVIIDFGNLSGTHVTGSAGSNGTAAVGAIGGTGGAGGTCNAAL